MRLVTFSHHEQIRLAALRADERGEWVADLNRLDPRLPTDMVAFLQGGAEMLALAKKAVAAAMPDQWLDRAAVALKAPILRPGKIIAIGQNYLEHAKESGASKAPHPHYFCQIRQCGDWPGRADCHSRCG